MRRMTAAATVLLIAGLVAGGVTAARAGGGGGCYRPTSDGNSTTVKLQASCFEPTVTHVPSGAEVTWVNEERMEHTVTGAGESWGSFQTLAKNDKVTHRFVKDGVYPYFCAFHAGMIGAVVVGDGSGPGGAVRTGLVVPAPEPPAAGGAADTPVDRSEGTGAARTALVAALFAAALGLSLWFFRRVRQPHVPA